MGRAFSSPPVGEWYNVEVVHQVEEGEYVYNVTIDGVVKYSTKNSDTSEFTDVLVYASDPWNPSQPSHIRALTIQTIMVFKLKISHTLTLFVSGLGTRTIDAEGPKKSGIPDLVRIRTNVPK